MASDELKPQRVAVIGSGLAGLTMAYLLTHPEQAGGRFDVTLYESAPTYGMDAHGMDIPCGCEACKPPANPRADSAHGSDSELDETAPRSPTKTMPADHVATERLDSPMRLVIDNYYTTLCSLYAHLGVSVVNTNFSATFTSVDPKTGAVAATPHYSDRLLTLPLLAPIRVPDILFRPWTQRTTVRIGLDRARLMRAARTLRRSRQLPTVRGTFGAYLAAEGYSREYTHGQLLPQLSTMLSAPFAGVLELPAAVVLDWLGRPDAKGTWCVVADGVQSVCRKLLQYLPEGKRRFATRVDRIDRDPDSGVFRVASSPVSGSNLAEVAEDEFDLVILATPTSVSASLVRTATGLSATGARAASLLSAFEYGTVDVVVHDDASVLPSPARAVNMASTVDDTMTTAVANQLRTLPPHVPTILQTTNPLSPIDPARVIARWTLPRARLTVASHAALDGLYGAQGADGMYFVGAPMFPGIPLLEGCVASAVDVAARLGVHRPWTMQDGEYLGQYTGEGEEGGSFTDAFLRGDLLYTPPGSRYATTAAAKESGSSGRGWLAAAAVAVGAAGWWAVKAGYLTSR
ncbi:hypothetical protein H9P43_004175 [Blastocladiella emersonii ATCC 22665]|nr:hypothetical protein H9P43_004175 [Blastocladiella emersonii ATCC 22665]